jgi:hypothetical protein
VYHKRNFARELQCGFDTRNESVYV